MDNLALTGKLKSANAAMRECAGGRIARKAGRPCDAGRADGVDDSEAPGASGRIMSEGFLRAADPASTILREPLDDQQARLWSERAIDPSLP